MLVSDSILSLKQDALKERSCHVQFVLKIARKLQSYYGGNSLVIDIAAILHDIWRWKELNWEHHSFAWVRIVSDFLLDYNLSKNDTDLILQCIKNHPAFETPLTIEEKIIISADAASKLEYHSSFVLMSKKKDILSRAQWWLKYLEKGYNMIAIPEYRNSLKSTYSFYKQQYELVISEVEWRDVWVF